MSGSKPHWGQTVWLAKRKPTVNHIGNAIKLIVRKVFGYYVCTRKKKLILSRASQKSACPRQKSINFIKVL